MTRLMTSGTTGLSPQVRGSPTACPFCMGDAGSIPAGAGEPRVLIAALPDMRVYPRRCGGAFRMAADPLRDVGLSPQVRGSLPAPAGYGSAAGSIPAGAGEPSRSLLHPIVDWVYPRRCGGANSEGRSGQSYRGLSPQVRGSPNSQHDPRRVVGSIPAGAGEPCLVDQPSGVWRVYPRRCGGASWLRRQRQQPLGLSPQVRGSPSMKAGRETRQGSIPAGAGEPW